MENHHHRLLPPSLPPPAIVIRQQTTLKFTNPQRDIDTRNSHSLQARQILHDINQSIKPSERWQALECALQFLSHDNVELHDVEINLGIDKALCLKLGYVVVTAQSICISKEVVLICKCFTEIFKCSSGNRLRSFRHIGATELLPLLMQLLTNIIQGKNERENKSLEFEDGLISLIRVLRVFSKLIPPKSYFINYLRGAFLGHLLRDILIWINEPSSSILHLYNEVLWQILGLVKDLSFRSRTDDKNLLLHLEGEIFFEIIAASFERIKGFHPRFQEWCTAITWNLVLDPSVCENLLSKNIGDDNQVGIMILEGLLQVLMQHSKNDNGSVLSLKIKRNATSALGNILSDSKSHDFLFQKKFEIKFSALIPQLACSSQEDPDPVIRRRALRTIRCLAGSTDIRTRNFVEKGNLSLFLIDIISQKEMTDDENAKDMLVQACQTVVALIESITVEVLSQLQIALLKRIENSTCTTIITSAVLCISECMSKSPITQNPSCFSTKFWNNLERQVSTSTKAHAAISGLFIVIAKVEKRRINTQNSEKPSILTITPIINALTTMLLKSEPGKECVRNQALEIVLNLAENEINKRPLAENDRLLSGLVTLCLMQPDTGIKDSAKRIILQLVPEM